MKLTRSLFDAYFKNQVSLENFIEKLGIHDKDFLDYFLCEMIEVSNLKDANMLEYFIYTLFLWEEQVGRDDLHELEKYVGILNELLVSDWHYKHEDIALLLQKISSYESIEFLYKAIEIQPQYLEWDDNYAFEVKCVRAIYHIGKEKAIPYLEKLCNHSNAVIREMAQRQIKKIR